MTKYCFYPPRQHGLFVSSTKVVLFIKLAMGYKYWPNWTEYGREAELKRFICSLEDSRILDWIIND